jgi:hypothetical protein
MKKRRLFVILSVILIVTMGFAACGKKSESAKYDYAENSAAYDMATADTAEPQEMPAAPPAVGMAEADGKVTYGSAGSINNSSAITIEDSVALKSQDKIIRTFYMDVETQEFDSLITKLDSEIGRLNGYVETSKVSGRSFYDRSGARVASIKARIPRDRVDEFVNVVGESANVINKQETTENVTLQYADIESRKKALEIEQERLFVLLEKADTLDSIVTLESRLSEIRYQLQNYETTLRTYDNKVEYSTVTLSIQEVEKLTPHVEIKQTVGTRIKNGFSQTMYNISEGLQNLLVWFVVNLPYLLIWAAIIAAIVLVIVKVYKKMMGDEASKKPPTPPAPPTNE